VPDKHAEAGAVDVGHAGEVGDAAGPRLPPYAAEVGLQSRGTAEIQFTGQAHHGHTVVIAGSQRRERDLVVQGGCHGCHLAYLEWSGAAKVWSSGSGDLAFIGLTAGDNFPPAKVRLIGPGDKILMATSTRRECHTDPPASCQDRRLSIHAYSQIRQR
jgi:hypothetical protein